MEEKIKATLESKEQFFEEKGMGAILFVFKDSVNENGEPDTDCRVSTFGTIPFPEVCRALLAGVIELVGDQIKRKCITTLEGVKTLAVLTAAFNKLREEAMRNWARDLVDDPNFSIKDLLNELAADIDTDDDDDMTAKSETNDFSS